MYETGETVVIVMEENQKFFDRITLDVQDVTMASSGVADKVWQDINLENLTDNNFTLIANVI